MALIRSISLFLHEAYDNHCFHRLGWEEVTVETHGRFSPVRGRCEIVECCRCGQKYRINEWDQRRVKL